LQWLHPLIQPAGAAAGAGKEIIYQLSFAIYQLSFCDAPAEPKRATTTCFK
jgi:hypothetical protein